MTKKIPDNAHARNITQTRGFDGYFKLDVIEAEPKSLKHGGWLPKMQREIFRVGDVACILPYDPKTDEVVLNQQFRMGPLLSGGDPFLLEIAAGLVDPGETPEEAALREGLEETGCKILDLETIAIYYPSPGSVDEIFHVYIGRIEKPTAGIFGLAHEAEEIKTHIMPALDAIAMADSGKIRNGNCLLALSWLARNREGLRKKWNKK